MKREPISKKLRFAVFARDGFQCRYCGRLGDDAVLHADHFRAASKGGATTMENLVTACAICNLGKSGDDQPFFIENQRGYALFGLFLDEVLTRFSDDPEFDLREAWKYLKEETFGVDFPARESLIALQQASTWGAAYRGMLAAFFGGPEEVRKIWPQCDNDEFFADYVI